MRASLALLGLCTLSLGHVGAPRRDDATLPNDNRKPAGGLRNGVLVVRLEARIGVWHPNGDDAPGAALPAFAEAGRPTQIPGPLIRVPAGTVAIVSIRNRLPNDTLTVRGLADRVAQSPAADSGIRLVPGVGRELRLRFAKPGTYYYYGTTTGREVNWRTGEDAQLTGAIVVDPAGAAPPPDRILVIGMWSDTVARAYTERHRLLAVVNGRTWPNTERFRYQVGDTVRWRVINASGDNHPMHLHGFYFRVESRGDGRGDTTYRAADADRVVTESMSPGTTMRMTWVPERSGNWLFHCHIPEHFGPRGPLGMPPVSGDAPAHAGANHAASDMSGLVVGIEVAPRAGSAEPTPDDRDRRRLRLVVRRNAGGSDTTPYFGFALQDGSAPPPADSGLHLGPPLVLRQGEPVGITVVNELAEHTAVHWHGIELQSYYDGVAGWSGAGQRLAPLIAPRDSFEARFTPPRAGTFIYHTHVNELRQEPAGLAGPIIVLAPGARWNPSTDHPVMITSPWSFEQGRRAVLVNGSLTPAPIELRSGVAHRLRIVNMTTRRPALRLELRRDTTLLAWRELAKDGNDLSESRREPRPAIHQISIGETLDVEITPDTPGDFRLEVRLGSALPAHPSFAVLPFKVIPSESRKLNLPAPDR